MPVHDNDHAIIISRDQVFQKDAAWFQQSPPPAFCLELSAVKPMKFFLEKLIMVIMSVQKNFLTAN